MSERWYCARCRGLADVVDAGDVYPRCRCGHRAHRAQRVRGPEPARNLVLLASAGYWFCPACERVTAPAGNQAVPEPRCVVCGGSIEFHEPIASAKTV